MIRSYGWASFDKPINVKHYLILLMTCYAGGLAAQSHLPTEHIFIITTDGFRWQEVFQGADPDMLGDPGFVKDPALMRQSYDDSTVAGRRKKLLPFFWNTIAVEGQLYGNRSFNNKPTGRYNSRSLLPLQHGMCYLWSISQM